MCLDPEMVMSDLTSGLMRDNLCFNDLRFKHDKHDDEKLNFD